MQKKKDGQLGVAYGTACNRLRRLVLFKLVVECKRDICYHCGKAIEFVDELSIEHKIPWLDSEEPEKLFFDLDNIAFSHLACNSAAARRTQTSKQSPEKRESNRLACKRYRDRKRRVSPVRVRPYSKRSA
jgi:hypothetical protein